MRQFLSNFFLIYPAPSNFNYFWNFGFLATVLLIIQIISGFALMEHYIPDVAWAFHSVEYIMREVDYGWLYRYVHANGASFFFLVVYLHIARSLYYGSFIYPRHEVWLSGCLILVLMIATAFLGYVLPWGQMSFWAATVITNLFTVIPFVGEEIVLWIWGGFSIDAATLDRLYGLHVYLPLVILATVYVHFILLHEVGSNNPFGVEADLDKIYFYPYYIVKDIQGLIICLMIFSYFVFFMPNYLGHPDNYIPANPMVTPAHIVPEWYFLPLYAILRSIPDKIAGIICLVFYILSLFILPFIADGDRSRSCKFNDFAAIAFYLFVVNFLMFVWLGSQPISDPIIYLGWFNIFLHVGLLTSIAVFTSDYEFVVRDALKRIKKKD